MIEIAYDLKDKIYLSILTALPDGNGWVLVGYQKVYVVTNLGLVKRIPAEFNENGPNEEGAKLLFFTNYHEAQFGYLNKQGNVVYNRDQGISLHKPNEDYILRLLPLESRKQYQYVEDEEDKQEKEENNILDRILTGMDFGLIVANKSLKQFRTFSLSEKYHGISMSSDDNTILIIKTDKKELKLFIIDNPFAET